MTVPTSKSPVWGIAPDELPTDDPGLLWAMAQDYRTSWDDPEDPVQVAAAARLREEQDAGQSARRMAEMRASLLRALDHEPPALDLDAIEVPPPLPPEDEARLRSRLIGTTRHVVDL